MGKITREEARSLGLKFYYTGRPCKYGHDSSRLVSNFGCYECSRSRTEEWEKDNHELSKGLKRTCYYNKHDYYKRCSKDYRRTHRDKYNWIKRRRSHWLNKYKVYTGCEECGFNGHPHALDFHHFNEENKLERVSRLKAGNLKILINEVRKCYVLCANCHRINHANEEAV